MIDKSFKKKKMPEGYFSASPLPSEQELSKFYKELYYQEKPTVTYQDSYSEDEINQKRLRSDLLVHSLLKAMGTRDGTGKSFLEVGFGEGFVLKAAVKQSFEVKGVDFSDFAVKHFHPELEQFVKADDAYRFLDELNESGEQHDVCVLQNVLEHVIDPVLMLKKISKSIKSDGLLAISVPNDFSRLQKRAEELGNIDRPYWFCPPQHLHYFNVNSLKNFVSANSFEVLDMFADFPIEFYTFHSGSNYTKNPAAGKDAHKARIHLDLLLAENGMDNYINFYRSLAQCGMGRNTTVVLRKKEIH